MAALVATTAVVVVAPEGARARGSAETAQPAAGTVTTVELTTPEGYTRPSPIEINRRGQVVASYTGPGNANAGIFWDQGDTEGTVITPSPASSGRDVAPFDLNDRGVVVGEFNEEPRRPCEASSPVTVHGSAFSWRAGAWGVPELGDGACASTATRVNNRGHVAGLQRVPTGPTALGTNVVVWRGGERFVAPIPSPGPGTFVLANGLNDRGQVLITTGDLAASTVTVTSYVWQVGGEITELGGLPGTTTVGVDINNQGQIVGHSRIANGYLQAFLWEDGEMTYLGNLGRDSNATNINERGQVIGNSSTADGKVHGFLWEDGELTDLGTLPEADDDRIYPNAINDRGQIVGTVATVGNVDDRAFLWEDGQMTELDGSTADDVNNRGQILGRRTSPDGTPRLVIWNIR
jgi:probable HAF family extracellular repeat protein